MKRLRGNFHMLHHGTSWTERLTKRCIPVAPEQVYNADVLRLRLETDRQVSKQAYNSDGETSESLTEPDSDTERHHRELGMIWIGHYRMQLRSPPFVPERGWTGGKGPLEKIPVDLIFCTKAFAKHGINLRNPHVRFNFSTEHKGLYITGCSRSSLAREKKVESYFEEREQYEANLQQETLVVLEWYKAPVAGLWSREEVLRS